MTKLAAVLALGITDKGLGVLLGMNQKWFNTFKKMTPTPLSATSSCR
jgi:hypothetical protein